MRYLMLLPLCLCLGCGPEIPKPKADESKWEKKSDSELQKEKGRREACAAGDKAAVAQIDKTLENRHTRRIVLGLRWAGVGFLLLAGLAIAVAVCVPALRAKALVGAAVCIGIGAVCWFLAELVPWLPFIGGILVFAGAVWLIWYAKKHYWTVAATGVGALNRFKHLVERLKLAYTKPDSDPLWGEIDRDASILLDELSRAGEGGSAAWKELNGIHAELKAKGRVVDAVGGV